MTHVIRYAARTDRGLLRANNQDSVFAGDRLLVIADGMGGHAAGDVASRLVVAAFVDLNELPLGADMVRPLTESTREGNAAIAEMVEENPELDGMGTTLTALLFDGPVVALAHVGDSRAYLYRNGVLHQISHDDTFVQSLVDDGRITADEAAHHPQRSLLLRALNGTEMDPSITMREVSPGDRFLICSDGLSDVVSPESIADALAGPDVDQVADTLIQLALVGGGPDNVTVIVADVLETGKQGGFGVVGAGLDPEATGPMQPIHLTQVMERVPLPPIPEDVPVRAEYAPVEEGPEPDDDYEEDEDTDESDYSSSTEPVAAVGPVGSDGRSVGPPRRRWHRRWAFALALIVLLGVGLTGSYLWASTRYYVGDDSDQVAVFRGVNGSLLGWKFASVEENSCGTTPSGACKPLKVTDLVQAARDQVSAGITVSTLADARSVIARLTSQQLPPCPTPGTTTTLSTATSSSAPVSSPVASSPVSSNLATTPATARSTATSATVVTTGRTTAGGLTTVAAPPITPVTTTVTVTLGPEASLGAGTEAGQRLRGPRVFGAAPTPTPTTRRTVAKTTPKTTPKTTAKTTPKTPVKTTPKTTAKATVPVVPSSATTAPITRAPATGTTPTVTVFTTVTSSPTAANTPTSTATPLVSPAAQPGITCRPAS